MAKVKPAVVVEAVARVLNDFPTNKAAAEHFGISPQYLHDILKQRRAIPDVLLNAAGYERVTIYQARVIEKEKRRGKV